LNPWPLPRSIMIMDNAKIHLFAELEDAIHQCGAHLLFLPPYFPELNPIEVCFGILKRWIQHHANLICSLYPETVFEVGIPLCMEEDQSMGFFSHCGYEQQELRSNICDAMLER